MRRRGFFSWLAGAAATGMASRTAKGSLVPETATVPLERRLYEALMDNRCSMWSHGEHLEMTGVMEPIVAREMGEWRKGKGIYRLLPPWEHLDHAAQISMYRIHQLDSHHDQGDVMRMVANEVRDCVDVVKLLESRGPQGRDDGRLRTMVHMSDRLDMRIVGFSVTTYSIYRKQ